MSDDADNDPPGAVETSPQRAWLDRAALLQLRWLDPHEATAQECEALGDQRAADRVRGCCVPGAFDPLGCFTCKRRECPTCSAIVARRNARYIANAIWKMDSPVLGLFELWSEGEEDLARTINEFRRCVTNLRRRECLRKVPRAVGAIETPFIVSSGRWLVHAHQSMDADLSNFDVEKVAEQWRTMTAGRGRFSLHPDRPRIAKKSARDVARYAAKATTWSPPAGELLPKHLEILRRAVKGRRLIVEWGLPNRPSDSRAKGPPPPTFWEPPAHSPAPLELELEQEDPQTFLTMEPVEGAP
jgi:hypothetical protein